VGSPQEKKTFEQSLYYNSPLFLDKVFEKVGFFNEETTEFYIADFEKQKEFNPPQRRRERKENQMKI
jgi:hypothetical protein